MRAFFESNGLRLAYRRWGSGGDFILAMHGYGRSADDFEIFAPTLLPNQSLIAIDLFGHGASHFDPGRNPNQPLTQVEWGALISDFLGSLGARQCSLLAYSIGGRMALCLLQSPQLHFKQAILLAPDGLKSNRFYWFVCNTSPGYFLFKNIVADPVVFLRIVKALSDIGLLHKKLQKFISYHLQDEGARKQLLTVWTFFRRCLPDLVQVKRLCDDRTEVHFVLGVFDQVIRPSLAGKLRRVGFQSAQVHLIDKGHDLMKPSIVEIMKERNISIG